MKKVITIIGGIAILIAIFSSCVRTTKHCAAYPNELQKETPNTALKESR